MSVNFKRPTAANLAAPKAKSVDDFIESAPDGKKNKGSMRGAKRAICLTVDPALLDQFDALVKGLGLNRGVALSMLMSKAVAGKVKLEKLY